ncbi:MAG: AAA family ATPase [Actinomycetota bacterium]
MRCVDRVELLATMRSGALDAIIAVGAPGWFDAQSAREATRAGIRVVGIAGNALEAEALEGRGAAVLDVGSSVGQIVDACRSEPATTPVVAPIESSDARSGDVVVVWGPKGSPGRTTIAIELAFALAATKEQTVLVDADPYGGDALQMLGIAEELPSVLWAATAAASDESRKDLVKQLRMLGNGGPLLIPGLPRAELWSEVAEYGFAELVKLLALSARFVVFDIGFCLEDSTSVAGVRDDRNLMARSALARADRVVAVCRADPIGVKNFIWSFDSLRDFVDDDRISVVLNRSFGGERAEFDDLLARHTGFRPVVAFPDKPHDCRRAIEHGGALQEVRPSSEICAQARTLAERLGGKIRPQGLLARLGGRS